MITAGVTSAIVISGMIKNKKKQINEINVNIEKYTHGVANAREALEHFEKAAAEMNTIADQVYISFKGQAADSFTNKLYEYRDFCNKRANQMKELIDALNTRLADFDIAKRNGEKSLQNLYVALGAAVAVSLV